MLRKLREAKGRAQADVARKADISPAQLARLETEQRGLYVDDFVRIAEVLGEKPGNLLPNDLGHIGHLKPLIDRLGGLEPEFLGRVEAILEKIILLTDDVMTTMRMQTVHDAHSNGDHRRRMPARTMARLEKILDGRSQHFSGVVSAERGIILSDTPHEIPKWAENSGARGVLRATTSAMRDVGIFDGDMLFVTPDRNPPNGKLAVCTVEDRVFVKIVKRDRNGHPLQLVSKSPGWPPIDLRSADTLKFFFVVVGIAGQR
ncbi:MAG: LexA family transcriptional regulator [Acidobacteriota bacterium]|nr:LexA family transcriptional regulator [Acidobacteriota bacterium]